MAVAPQELRGRGRISLKESARNFLQRKSDERHLAKRSRRVAAVEERLGQITQGLDINERILFSTAYRFSRRVPTLFDYEFSETFRPGIELNLNPLLAGLSKEGQELTPDILWTWVPEMDPNRKKTTGNKVSIRRARGSRNC